MSAEPQGWAPEELAALAGDLAEERRPSEDAVPRFARRIQLLRLRRLRAAGFSTRPRRELP